LQAVRAGELPEQAGLADSGLADHRDDLAVPGLRFLHGLVELLDLAVASDEAGEPARGGSVQPRADRSRPDDLVDLDRFGKALHRNGPSRRDLDVPLGELQSHRRQQDRARRGELLHAGREVRGLTHRGVVHVQIGADGPNDHPARVETDTDLDEDAVRTEHVLGVPLDRLLHPERRIAGADGMILVRHRCAEQRHDPIAHDLIHRALVAVDGFHHELEHRIEELARVLGITVAQELHRALEIGEEHGDLLALALEHALGREDLLGQVLGRVRARGSEAGLSAGRSAHGMRTLQTELGGRGELATAVCAPSRERSRALQAELRPRGILSLASRARHPVVPS
jgi:hypothetical protein